MKLALAQLASRPGDAAANLAAIDEAAARAAAAGAALLLTPELSVPGYGAADAMAACAEDGPEGGRQGETLAAIARARGIALVAGIALPAAGGGLFNAALFTDGTRQVVYRKTHLYGPYEKDLFVPGPIEAATFAFAGLRCGMLICYDVEFPENVRRLARAGADLILAPTALPAGPGADVIARCMIPTRAFENGLHLAYCNVAGGDGRFAYAGRSAVAAPDGRLLAAAGLGPDLMTAEIRPDAYAATRAANPYLAELRG